jgi:long-chain fatty acid transport protein
MQSFYRSLFLTVLCILVAATSAQAAGLWLYEEATPDMGVAAAGRQAAALDASTSSGNPAGMTRLDRSQMEGGFLGIYPVAEFEVDQATYSGGGGGNAGYFVPSGTFYYVHSLNQDLKLGVGLGSYFGLGLDYNNDWSGRYYAQKGELLTLFLNPTVAYRVTPWLSIGGGVNFIYGKMEARTAINTIAEPGDGRVKYNADDMGYGFNAGVLFEVSPRTRFGVTYVSEVKLNFKDQPNFDNIQGTVIGAALKANGIIDSTLQIDLHLPQQVAVGAYHQLTDKLTLVASANWQDWSRFGDPEISVSGVNSINPDLDWKDTWHVGLGAYYRVAEPWLLMFGWAYDSSPISTSERSPAAPLDRQFRYATGVQYEWNKDVSLGLAYTLIDAGNAKIDKTGAPLLKGDLQGKYDPNLINVFNLNFVYRF